MHTVSAVLALAATGGALLLSAAPGDDPAPAVGPGSVIMTVEAFLAAADAGDVEALTDLMASEVHGQPYGWLADDAEPELRPIAEGAYPRFFDADGAGRIISAVEPQGFARQLIAVGRDGEGGRGASRLVSIYADCASGPLSWATVEFDRVRGEATAGRTQRLRATVLMSYDAEAKPTGWRIFHWHAAVSTAAEVAAAESK